MGVRGWVLAAAAGQVAHEAVELAGGTGVIGQERLGLGGALAATGGLAVAQAVVAPRPGPIADRLSALGAGIGLGVPLVHFTMWPWRLRGPLPLLVEAERLPRSWMPVYNGVLHVWAAASAAALVRDVPSGRRRWAALGVVGAFAFRPVARRHLRWIEEQAERNPAWWNRAGRDGGASR